MKKVKKVVSSKVFLIVVCVLIGWLVVPQIPSMFRGIGNGLEAVRWSWLSFVVGAAFSAIVVIIVTTILERRNSDYDKQRKKHKKRIHIKEAWNALRGKETDPVIENSTVVVSKEGETPPEVLTGDVEDENLRRVDEIIAEACEALLRED